MGLFKDILSSAVGDSVADALNVKSAKGALDSLKQKVTKSAMESVTETATGVAVGATISAAANALLNKKKNVGTNTSNPLQTPPPPPGIPAPVQTMSVMVAVNGQTYGPYERATLIEMIANGSLTRNTYVFIQGMEGWKTAAEVPQVAELFNNDHPVPAVPPLPWAEENSQPVPTAQSGNTLSARLNQLINAAVADGEISDLERQVLIRNAQEEGVSMDEFVMVLEARLFEQQQVLREKIAEKERKDKIAAAQMQAKISTPSTPPKPMTKCPHCGAPVKALAISCPECGYDYPASTNVSSSWEQLIAKLEAIDAKEKPKRSLLADFFANDDAEKESLKAEAIQKHPIPSTKTDIVDFFTYCAPLGKKSGFFSKSDIDEHGSVYEAYRAKAQQVLIKARIILKDDQDLLAQIEAIAKQYKI